jgi:hypothetical protein
MDQIADFAAFGYELQHVLHYAYITSPCTTLWRHMSVMVELAGEILEVTWSRPMDQIADFPTAFWL